MLDYMSFDTETTGFSIFHGARPFLFIGTREKGEGYSTLCTEDAEKFRKYLEDPNIIKIMHNGKFDILMMKSVGIEVKGLIYDTMIAAHLLDENNSCSLKYCASRYVGERKQSDEINNWFIANKIKKADRNYADVPMEIMEDYARADAELTYKLFFILKPLLEEQDLWELFEQECNLIYPLVDMYCRGLQIDVPYFAASRQGFVDEALVLEKQIIETAKQDFNILSNTQLGNLLVRAGVDLPLTKTGKPSVSKDSLAKVSHPLVQDILKYRTLMKFISTFIDSLVNKSVNGIIHSELWAQGTVTGRFSSSDPNLQNIPKPDEDVKNSEVIRKGFTCREGYVNFYFDFSQQEYRVFLDYIKEEDIIHEINVNKIDFHTLVYNEMKDSIKDRKATKTFNFMLIYGGGALKLAGMLGLKASDQDLIDWQNNEPRMMELYKNGDWLLSFLIKKGSVEQSMHTVENCIRVGKALEIKDKYFSRFTKVKPFMKLVADTIKFRGYVRNKFGRRRRLRSSESYKAPNALIQGGCADYIKNRMIEVYKLLSSLRSSMLFQIHDELIVEVHLDELHVVEKIKEIMEDCHRWFKVNLDVDVEYSTTNWADKKEWKGSLDD